MSTGDSKVMGRPGAVFNTSALVFGVATVGLLSSESAIVFGGAVLGIFALIVGVSFERRRIVATGTFFLFGSVLLAGALGAPAERFLPSVATALLAWNCTNASVSIQDEIRGGTVERSELLHVATATTAAGFGIILAYLAHRLLLFPPSDDGVILLVVAAILLGFALRNY